MFSGFIHSSCQIQFSLIKSSILTKKKKSNTIFKTFFYLQNICNYFYKDSYQILITCFKYKEGFICHQSTKNVICIDNVVYALALEINMPKYKSWLYQPKQLSSWPFQTYMSCVCPFSGLISYLPSHSSRSIGFLAFLRHKLLTLYSLFSLSYFLNCSVVAIQPVLLFYPDLFSNATHDRKCSRSWSQAKYYPPAVTHSHIHCSFLFSG